MDIRGPGSCRADWAASISVARRIVILGFRIPRRALLHGIDELLGLDVCQIAARRREARVTELGLDQVHRMPLCGQLCRVAVSQAVRMNPLFDPCLGRQSLHQVPDVAGVDRLPLQGAEERGAARESQLFPCVHPAVDRCKGAGVDPSDAGLVSLPVEDTECAGLAVDILGLQGERLGVPQTGSVEDRDEGSVADPGRGTVGAGSKQLGNLGGGQDLGRVGHALVGGLEGGGHGVPPE